MSTRPSTTVAPMVRTMQIIKFALFMGVTAFGGVSVMLVMGRDKPPDASSLPWIMLGFGAWMLVMRLIVPRIICRSQLKTLAADEKEVGDIQLTSVYQSQMIVGSALLEGGAFANLFSFMTTGQFLSAGVASLLAIGILIDFPTNSRVETWLADQRQKLRDERQMKRLSGQ